MTDIVERLRDLARVAEDVPPDFQQIQWLLDAADEIERLREDLRLGMIKTGTTILDKETEIERLRGLLTAWVLAFEESDYPETMVEKVSYGSDTGIGTEKSLVFRTNEALGRVPKPF